MFSHNVYLQRYVFAQDFLLHHMGLAPAGEKPWPLTVSQRCLGVLARILLSRQQKGKRKGPQGMDIPECVSIWKRVIGALKQKALPKDCFYKFEGKTLFDSHLKSPDNCN